MSVENSHNGEKNKGRRAQVRPWNDGLKVKTQNE